MKRCPKCNLNYEDNSLEFCLEDGTRLASPTNFNTEIPTVTHSNNPNSTTAKTVSLPFSEQAANPDLQIAEKSPIFPQTTQIKEKAIEQTNKMLEIAPVILALAHNWWQWIYLNKQSYSSFVEYVFSANFLVWVLLLVIGAILGLVSFKRLQNKGFAIVSLVTLAINFILFLVPKR